MFSHVQGLADILYILMKGTLYNVHSLICPNQVQTKKFGLAVLIV